MGYKNKSHNITELKQNPRSTMSLYACLHRFIIFPLVVYIAHYFMPVPSDNQVNWRHYIFAHTIFSWFHDYAVPLIEQCVHGKSIVVDMSILLILFILMLYFYVISYVTIVVIEPDRYLTTFIMFSKEKNQYTKLYKELNGSPPPNVYILNFRYNNIYECSICMDEFCKLSHGNESILHCGHRYHSSCLRQWELQQFHDDPYSNYHCPLCNSQYIWMKKYQYIYTIQHC